MSELTATTPTMKMLERSLDLIAQRHQVLLANVANEETPRFKAKDLVFQSVLDSMARPGLKGVPMATSDAAPHSRHFPLPGGPDGINPPEIKDSPTKSPGLDGNTVSMEKTMAALHENSTLYSAASQIITKKYQSLLGAIRDAR
jgi:flagellar basal-body rod protein FlgB